MNVNLKVHLWLFVCLMHSTLFVPLFLAYCVSNNINQLRMNVLYIWQTHSHFHRGSHSWMCFACTIVVLPYKNLLSLFLSICNRILCHFVCLYLVLASVGHTQCLLLQAFFEGPPAVGGGGNYGATSAVLARCP